MRMYNASTMKVSSSQTVCVAGATSVLGWALHRVSKQDPRHPVVACCSPHNRRPSTRDWVRFDVEDSAGWEHLFRRHGVGTVIYAAGVCDVGRAEADPSFAWSVNVGGVEALSTAMPANVRLVYVSSDHVFGGRDAPYLETDDRCPISAYGRIRAAAEARISSRHPTALVVRVGLPIGPSLDGRTGHLDWLQYRHRRRLPMTLIRDEYRSAIDAEVAARRILALAKSSATGIRHAAAPAISRPELATRLCRSLDINPTFELRNRSQLKVPHLGHVELGTMHGREEHSVGVVQCMNGGGRIQRNRDHQ